MTVTQLSASGSAKGFTLVEAVITMAISGVVLAALMSVTVFVTRSFIAISNYRDLNQSSRFTLDMMGRDVRNAAGLTYYTTNNITLTNNDNTGFSYQWDPSSRALMRYYTNSDGTTAVNIMLTNCDVITFNIYQRNPTNNLTFVSAVSAPNQTKLINVDWKCSRTIMGAKANTESVQTAQIVIRN